MLWERAFDLSGAVASLPGLERTQAHNMLISCGCMQLSCCPPHTWFSGQPHHSYRWRDRRYESLQLPSYTAGPLRGQAIHRVREDQRQGQARASEAHIPRFQTIAKGRSDSCQIPKCASKDILMRTWAVRIRDSVPVIRRATITPHQRSSPQ